MIFQIAFNIIGVGMLIWSAYAGLKMVSMGLTLRQRNSDLIGKGWNGRVTIKQLKKLKIVTTDERSKQAIDEFLKYSRRSRLILIAGIGLLLLIGFWNSTLNK